VAPPPFWLWQQVLRSDPATLPRAALSDDPEAARFLLFEAVAERLRLESEGGGLLIVLDDVQRADEPSLLLLRHLIRQLDDDRLLILATERTVASEATGAWQAVLPDLLREPVTERLHLQGLTVEESIRCVAAITGRTVDNRTGHALQRATKGNPFFVSELAWGVTTMAANGDLPVPGSILEVVARRVDRLSSEARRLLAAAAVLGEQFALPVAASLVDRPVTACLPFLQEATDAGLLEPAVVAGDWRFSHALVRNALEARIPLADRIALHRHAAEAIERTYAAQLEARAADLARHWAVVAATGERAQAVLWARRAAEEAMRLLAFEESARLYRLGLDAGGPSLDDDTRAGLLLDLAEADWRSGRLEVARATCKEVADAARRTHRADLLAEAALALEPIGALAWDLDLALWCKEALAGVDDADVALRARLLARLTEASVYAGEDEAGAQTSDQALHLADASGDATAVVAALRARQLALSGPEHGGERTVLADRMVDAGLVLRRPSVEMWGRLWRIDTHWERGELADIAGALPRLEWCVGRVGGPFARWHLLVARAALAQAMARFDDALALGAEAFESVQAVRHPVAFGAFASVLGPIGHHIGHDRASAALLPAALLAPPFDPGEVHAGIFSHVGPALALCESGRPDEARAAYCGAGPVDRWRPPPYFRVLAWALGSLVAVALDLGDDVEYFYRRLGAERGRHVVGGAGNASYFGPVELHLGRAAAHLGRLEEAEADLRAAAAICRTIGAAGFAVEADCELAQVLARRGVKAQARAVAAAAQAEAIRLGMTPWAHRAASVLDALGPEGGADEALSPRELEVAQLVAKGETNRAIAAALFVSERTAQTHVQHILTKLGFSNRSQIASWVARQQ
jgi:DNA-binding CsgD family transcriptional regulator